MNWRFWQKEDSLDHLPAANLEAASDAEGEATRRLAFIRKNGAETRRLSASLHTLRARNHFAELINETLSERYE